MKIIALPGDLSACAYYRVFAPLAAMERQGLAEVHRPPVRHKPNGRPDVKIRGQDLRGFDVAVFQRQSEAHIGALMEIARKLGVKTAFDLDDDMFSVTPASPAYMTFGRDYRKLGARVPPEPQQRLVGGVAVEDPHATARRRIEKAQEMRQDAMGRLRGMLDNLRAADLVTVSTPRLAEVYGAYRDDVVVLSNQVEPADWEAARANPLPKPEGEVWIGWAGSKTHWSDLELVKRPLAQVLRRNPAARLVLVGFPEAKDLFWKADEQVYAFEWMDIEQYRHVVAAFDVALAPSAPSTFNEAKSDIRVLEAALCGVPVVASETTYGATVRAAGCGYVAKTAGKWLSYLNRLVSDPDLRAEMGAAGREYVLGERTYALNAWRWAEVYSRLL